MCIGNQRSSSAVEEKVARVAHRQAEWCVFSVILLSGYALEQGADRARKPG